jgi:NodT family efflux transporter outer membrane factor (OMF) lipoprotein
VTNENYGASLDASWEVDLFGKQRQNVRAASADLAQSQENFYAAQVSLAAETATAYVDLRAAESKLTVLGNSIATREQTVQLTQWREQAGQGNALETQQAITSLEQARTAVPVLKQTIEQTRNQLTLLAGKPPGAMDRLLAREHPVPAPPSKIALGIPAETLRQRPDVRAAEHAVNAAFFRTKAAEAERYPSLNLSGSIGVEALKAGRIFSPESTAASILGSLAAPIFDAGRIKQNVTIQNERQKQALITYESTVLTALSEVENALIAIQRTSETLEVVNRAVIAAREAAKLASQRYEAGDVDLLNVLDAQRTLLSLEDQQVTTTGNRASAHIQLYRALGGGWSSGS